jgi:tetratricopeptide (TPR) repeat protein
MSQTLHRLCASYALMPALLTFGVLFGGCSRQSREARHLKQADKFYSSGQLDKAEIEYRNVLQMEALNPQAIGRLGLVYSKEGRIDRALPYLRKGVELQPDNLDNWLYLSKIYLAAGDFKAARDGANLILDKNPNDPEAPSLLAQTAVHPAEYLEISRRLETLPAPAPKGAPVVLALGVLKMRRQDLAGAEASFRKALEIDPDMRAAKLALGTLLWSRKDMGQAEKMLAAAASEAPARSIETLQYAQFKVETGDADEGKRILGEMTAKAPDFVPAWLQLAKIATQKKKGDEGSALVSKVLALDPGNAEALLLGAQIKMAAGDNKGAVMDLERMQQLYPKSAQAYYQVAQGYTAMGDLVLAAQSLNRAIALAPDFIEAHILLAETNIRRKDFMAAFISMKQLVQEKPGFLQAWLLMADADRALGRFDDALAVYQHVERIFPGRAETSLLTGLVLLQQNKRAEARGAFNTALERSPGYTGAAEQLINLDILEKNLPAAATRAQGEVQRHPTLAAPRVLLARCLLAEQKEADAERELKKAIELQPDSTNAIYLLAHLYIVTNRQQTALNDLRKVVDSDPKAVRALMLMANIYFQQNDFAAARDAYERLLTIDPKSGSALNNLAYIYSERFGDLDKAYELAQRALEAQPGEPHVADTLGWIQFKRRKFASALNLLQESAADLPADAEVQFHLGMTDYYLGNEEAARIAFQNALQLDPAFHDKDTVAGHLRIITTEVASLDSTQLETLIARLKPATDDPVALTMLGQANERQGSFDKAVSANQAALGINPEFKPALLNLLRLYSDHGDTQRAIVTANAARKLDPSDPKIARALGHLVYQTGDYKWASSLLEEAAASAPDDPGIQEELGQAMYGVGRISESVAATRLALQLGIPPAEAVKANRMLDMIALSENPAIDPAASEKVEVILKSDPNYVPALMALGSIEEQRSDSKRGLETYQMVLGLRPEFAPATKRLAVLYSENSLDDKKALELATKAREVYPEDAELAKAYGIIVYRTGDFASSVTILQKAAKQRSNDAELIFYLGMAEDRLNRRAQSKDDLKRALTMNLRPDLAADAKRVLGDLN